jgi:hypothetical protein
VSTFRRIGEVMTGKHIDRHALDYRQTAARRTRVWNRELQQFDAISGKDGLEKDKETKVVEPEKWYGVVGGEFVVAVSIPMPQSREEFSRVIREGVTVEQRLPVAPTPTRTEITERIIHTGKMREDGFLRCGRCGERLPDNGEFVAVKWGYFCTQEHADEACPFVKVVEREAKR